MPIQWNEIENVTYFQNILTEGCVLSEFSNIASFINIIYFRRLIQVYNLNSDTIHFGRLRILQT